MAERQWSGDVRRKPADAVERVAALPPRVAHAVHALLETGNNEGYGPFTAAEVCVYDSHLEALTPSHTAQALRHAARLGLAMYIRGLWTPTPLAGDLRQELEDRFGADTEGERGSE